MSLAQRWADAHARPLSLLDPSHVQACFAEEVSPTEIEALCLNPRFQPRLVDVVRTHYGLPVLTTVPDPAAEDLPVLLLSADAFAQLPHLCGALWHSAALGREIRRDAVEHLRGALGTGVFTLALMHRQWSGAVDLLRQPAELLAAIELDGARCLQAWLDTQPAGLRAWLKLRLPTPLMAESGGNVDPGLVRRAAGLLQADPEVNP